MNYAKWVLLLTSFFEGFIRFPMDVLLFYYIRNRVAIDVQSAKAIVHLQRCVFYYSMSVFPTVLSRTTPALMINFISSSLTLLCFIVMSILELLSITEADPPGKYMLYIYDPAVKGSKLSIITLLTVFSGAKTLTARHLLIQQFSPKEDASYNKFRVHRSTVLGIGRILGLLFTIYFSCSGPHLHFRNFFIVLTVASAIDCILLSLGFFLPDLRLVARIPRGLLKFFKLQRRVIKEKFFTKQVQEDQLTEQQEAAEEWKALVKVLPLFIPTVFIIAFSDQKYTEYIYQEEMLVPDIRVDVVLPMVLIYVTYPVTKMLGTIIVDGIVMPYMKKKGKPLTTATRALTGFTFVTLSFAAATILQCHVERTKLYIKKGDEARIVLYNSCDCPGIITVTGLETEVTSPPMSITNIDIPRYLNSILMTIRVECTGEDKYVTKKDIDNSGQPMEYLLFKNSPRSISVVRTEASRRTNVFFDIHTLMRLILVPFCDEYTCKDTEVTIEKENETVIMIDKGITIKDEHLTTGRYFVIADGITLLDLNIDYSASLTCMVVTQGNFRIPKTKLFTLVPPNSISIYYQLPQTFILALADVMLESPTFVYASNAVPKKWWNLVNDLWLISGGTGNLITATVMFFDAINRLVLVFLLGFGSCWLSLAIFVQLSSSMYNVNYEFLEEPEDADITK